MPSRNGSEPGPPAKYSRNIFTRGDLGDLCIDDSLEVHVLAYNSNERPRVGLV